MDKPKGGRGVKAAYETTHVRVPLPVKDEVEAIISRYRDGGDIEGNSYPIGAVAAIDQARKIARQKKSAKVSMEKLLTAIYGHSISIQFED